MSIPRSNKKFHPTVYSNQRPILTPEDLGNHPLAEEYINYIKHINYPTDFKTWLKRYENIKSNRSKRDRIQIELAIDDPYCRSHLKPRVFKSR